MIDEIKANKEADFHLLQIDRIVDRVHSQPVRNQGKPPRKAIEDWYIKKVIYGN